LLLRVPYLAEFNFLAFVWLKKPPSHHTIFSCRKRYSLGMQILVIFAAANMARQPNAEATTSNGALINPRGKS
jgi:hypothetical protein